MERVFSRFRKAQVVKRRTSIDGTQNQGKIRREPPFHMGFTVENQDSMHSSAPYRAAVHRVIK